jgi:protein-disulfide isomerase
LSTLKIDVSDQDHAQGNANAACTLVEYGDFECPHCARAHPIVKRIEHHFGDRLRFVFRNFPLTQIHPNAEPAAEVAEFAGSQGRFWDMHDLLFQNQNRLSEETFEELSVQLDLDPAKTYQALENKTFTNRVRADFTGGVRSGVNGTPTFFINGQRHNGPFDFDTLVRAIEAAMLP